MAHTATHSDDQFHFSSDMEERRGSRTELQFSAARFRSAASSPSARPSCRFAAAALSRLFAAWFVSLRFARFTYIFNFWFSTFVAFIVFSSRPLTLKHRRAFAHLQHGDCNQTRPQHNRPMYLTYFHPLLCDSAVGDIAPSARCASMAAAEAASCGHCTTNSSTTG